MRRDYSTFVDDSYIKNDQILPCLKHEIRQTIEEDDIDDAVENIIDLIMESKNEL